MKYIFDFDDVLFNNTKQFKKHIYACLEEVGIKKENAEEYYKEVREIEFSLRNFIENLFIRSGKDLSKVEEIYEKIMSECKNFTNIELLKQIEKLGKENCFIITNGE